jgi:hypothetical protein
LTATLTDQLALCDTLRTAMLTANSLDGKHAYQNGGSYGAIMDAVIKTLAVTLEGQGHGPRKALRVARALEYHAVDNGESITYNYRLWEQGVIDA